MIRMRAGSRRCLRAMASMRLRKRGRKEHRLPARWRLGEDRLKILGEAHVEHLVGLVEDHHLLAM